MQDRTEFPDNVLLRYLLGQGRERECTAVEGRLVSDERFAEHLSAVENELIRDYLQQELSQRQVRMFERQLLASPELQRKTESARWLMAALAAGNPVSAAAMPSSSWRAIKRMFVPSGWPGAQFAVVCLSVFVLVSGLTWLARDDLSLRNRLASVESRLREATHSAPLTSFVLAPGLTRDDTKRPRLLIPSSVGLVQFHMEGLQQPRYGRYRASLRRVDGGLQVWSDDVDNPSPSASGYIVEAVVPASALDTGDYFMSLTGISRGADSQEVESYSFGVVRRR